MVTPRPVLRMAPWLNALGYCLRCLTILNKKSHMLTYLAVSPGNYVASPGWRWELWPGLWFVARAQFPKYYILCSCDWVCKASHWSVGATGPWSRPRLQTFTLVSSSIQLATETRGCHLLSLFRLDSLSVACAKGFLQVSAFLACSVLLTISLKHQTPVSVLLPPIHPLWQDQILPAAIACLCE